MHLTHAGIEIPCTPYRWWLVPRSLLYLPSSVDLSPAVFPLLGWLDDGWLAAVLVGELMTPVFGKAMLDDD
ncbi:MAG: DUF1232 domain-containing protein [Gloeomargarita sp. GMQP_bins_120]